MTDQQQKALRLLGLARRARLLEIGEEPVYLLDDVLGELDEERKSYILSRTGGRQLIVTACEKNDYDALVGVKKIRVCGGHYTEDR